MVPGVREGAAARVPAKVMQFISPGREVGPADHLAVPRRRWVGVEYGERVRLSCRAVEGDHVSE
jgi:hypothetical protein